MDQFLLNKLAEELKIAPLNILREEIEMLVLFNISEQEFARNIVFYGGTALRLAYNCPRFSEDLDFLMIEPVKETELNKSLENTINQYPGLSIADLKDKRNTIFALLKLQSPYLKHSLSIKIEISKKKNGIKKEFKALASPCSPLQPTLYTATLGSLEKTKWDALRGRDAPRDWFDAYYISSLLRKPFNPNVGFKYDKNNFKRELRRFLPKDKWELIDESLKNV